MKYTEGNKTLILLIAFLLAVSCQQSKRKWDDMINAPDNTIQSHTDTTPHAEGFRQDLFNIHQTSIPHAIATNDWGNAINVLYLNENGLKVEEISRNFLNCVSGGDISSAPLFSNEWIGYGQTRGFVRFNLRTKEFIDQNVCDGFEETISSCCALDPGKNIFAFVICFLKGSTEKSILKVFDLSGREPLLLALLDLGEIPALNVSATFTVRDSVIFYHDERSNKLISLDKNLKPIDHPFTLAFDEHRLKFADLVNIAVHPSMPFAFVQGSLSGVLTWKDGKKDLLPFIGMKADSNVYFNSFSPDGKYAAWESISTEYNSEEKPVYWAAKIDPNIPGYFGKPIKLGTTLKGGRVTATSWATNPTTFVVCEMNMLYWWHLE